MMIDMIVTTLLQINIDPAINRGLEDEFPQNMSIFRVTPGRLLPRNPRAMEKFQ